jgi:FkbM family methyltransferase
VRYKNNIFDVGAFNGLDGLILAIKNPETMVHAFEANPNLIKEIKRNKKKIELFKKIKIKNYKINNYAVSNKNGLLKFNIAKNPTVSSLNEFSNNLDITWPGYREAHCTVVKKIKVKSITLEKYCNDNKINIINYLHVDTQGSDLKVLKGLKKKIKIVQKGVLEAALNLKNSLYKKNHTIKEAKFFLMKNKFKILKIEDVDENIKNEKNIFFYKKNSSNFKKINIKYNLRYYNRIISDRTNLKDKFINFLSKLF